jgi:hypothetical protein
MVCVLTHYHIEPTEYRTDINPVRGDTNQGEVFHEISPVHGDTI